MAIVYISIGSNMGDRQAYLQQGIDAVARSIGDIVGISAVVETPAIGFEGNPFLNACFALETSRSPDVAMQELLAIEKAHGRVRSTSEGYINRTLDLDMLFYDDLILDTPQLKLPHPALEKRRFVLQPLSEIAANKAHPRLKKTVQELLTVCPDNTAISAHEGHLRHPLYAPLQQHTFICVEGIIGSGKTTLATLLAQQLGYKTIEERFAEKLATPDVTVADIIGDVDPIKAANLKLSYADDRVIHFGMIPRANRCIFVINELPDLQARIQVALFNILQEGDIQIRGFKLRLPLDMQFLFTANPEDYTNRGSIVTPLKDRIGSQILTHYPKDIATAKKITEQEAKKVLSDFSMIEVPELAKDILEQISFEARKSDFIDVKSGVSARMSISAFQNLVSAAERRLYKNKDTTTAIRLSDFFSIVPAITGKVELVYEGEQEGAANVAEYLIGDAIKSTFLNYFPKIEKLDKPGESQWFQPVIDWFVEEGEFELYDDLSNKEYKAQLDRVLPLNTILEKYQPNVKDEQGIYFLKEFILWALVEHEKLTKEKFVEGVQFRDNYSSLLKGI